MPSQQTQPVAEPPSDLPLSVEPYVKAFGVDQAAHFLLNFGGRHIHVPARARGSSPLANAIGSDRVQALRAVVGHGKLKVPLAKPWLARQLAAKGMSRPDIARLLHVTRESVRGYLKGQAPGGREEARTC